MNLPSGGTIDLTNFVAIVPLEQSDRHQLLFAGLGQPLTIDSRNERLLQGKRDPTANELMPPPLKYFCQLENLRAV